MVMVHDSCIGQEWPRSAIAPKTVDIDIITRFFVLGIGVPHSACLTTGNVTIIAINKAAKRLGNLPVHANQKKKVDSRVFPLGLSHGMA